MDMKRILVITESARAGADEDETSVMENEPTSEEMPGNCAGGQGNRGHRQCSHGGLARGFAAGRALREIEGLSYEDIAEVMGCPIGMVRSHFPCTRSNFCRSKPLLSNQTGNGGESALQPGKYRNMVNRAFTRVAVSRIRNGYGYCCGLRPALRANVSISMCSSLPSCSTRCKQSKAQERVQV